MSTVRSPLNEKYTRLTNLAPSFRERVWGATALEPWFFNRVEKTGEVWFGGDENDSLLIKLIFTAENLSLQVHPPDEFAREYENSRGKTEMWHILDAAPGSAVAIGFRESITRDRFEDALNRGGVDELLRWVPAHVGDTFFVPAGVVHAIGAGLTLCEIQQNSDITYRLYDYGRPRELHLERGLAICQFTPYFGKISLPFRCRYFTVDKIEISRTTRFELRNENTWVVLQGRGELNGRPYRAGEAWRVVENDSSVVVDPSETSTFLKIGPEL